MTLDLNFFVSILIYNGTVDRFSIIAVFISVIADKTNDSQYLVILLT